MELENKVIVITGASTGIGKELAFQLSRMKNKVVLAARSARELFDIADQIKRDGGTALVVPTDVSRKYQVDMLVQRTVREFGRIDVFISNAGITHKPLALTELKEEDIRPVMETNFMGTVHAVWAAAPEMEKTGGGLMVFVSSIVGKVGIPHNSIYCASKFAIQGLIQSIRAELSKKKIRIVNICPPGVDTPFFEKNGRDSERRFRLHPVQKIARMIVRACEKETREALLTIDSKILNAANFFLPSLLDSIVAKKRGI